MGERKGVNKYYPPDFDPSKGGLNAYHGTHALRERARKLHEGILIIRFEMPYNIWCNGCGNHIGMGVRYNARKRKVGNYYTTPIYKFRMKCHLCDQHFEIRTDPKNCDYEILSGCRRKEERWDTEKAGNVQTTDREVKEKLMTNAMYKLEHQAVDEGKVKKLAPTLSRLEEIRDTWEDDFAVNQLLRKKFRNEKKEMAAETEKDDNLKRKLGLPLDLELEKESDEDMEKARSISYGIDGGKISLVQKKKRVEESSIFGTSGNAKMDLAKSLASKTKKPHAISSSSKIHSSFEHFGVKIVTKKNNAFSTKEISPADELLSDSITSDYVDACGSVEDNNSSFTGSSGVSESSNNNVKNELDHNSTTSTMNLARTDKMSVEDTQTMNVSKCDSNLPCDSAMETIAITPHNLSNHNSVNETTSPGELRSQRSSLVDYCSSSNSDDDDDD